jgi:hypothetical protein
MNFQVGAIEYSMESSTRLLFQHGLSDGNGMASEVERLWQAWHDVEDLAGAGFALEGHARDLTDFRGCRVRQVN